MQVEFHSFLVYPSMATDNCEWCQCMRNISIIVITSKLTWVEHLIESSPCKGGMDSEIPLGISISLYPWGTSISLYPCETVIFQRYGSLPPVSQNSFHTVQGGKIQRKIKPWFQQNPLSTAEYVTVFIPLIGCIHGLRCKVNIETVLHMLCKALFSTNFHKLRHFCWFKTFKLSWNKVRLFFQLLISQDVLKLYHFLM